MNKTDLKMSALTKVTSSQYEYMVKYLKAIQKDIGRGEEIDVRLCIDFDTDDRASWTIRYDDASYDQRHSELCGASSIDKSTKFNLEADETLEDLINQCMDQLASAQ